MRIWKENLRDVNLVGGSLDKFQNELSKFCPCVKQSH